MEESQQLHFPAHHNYNGNGNNNKPLNVSGPDGSGQLVDSGYTSFHSFSASCSVPRSVLATIEEDNEADNSFEEVRSTVDSFQVTSNILTPTTAASIERISNFHLTTPNSVGKQVEKRTVLARKPTFENLFEQRTPKKVEDASFFGLTGTPNRSDRKSELGSLTPRKNRDSAKRKLGHFREKLYSDGDARQLGAVGGLDDSLEEDCKKLDQEELSPIFHAKRRRNSDIDNLIRSSTPKTASVMSNFHVGGRENIDWDAVEQGKLGPMRKPLRRFQSFSPGKMHSYQKRDSVLQEKSVIANRRAPFKRQNAMREPSLKQDSSISSTPRKSQELSVEQSFELLPEIPITPPKQTNLDALLGAPILVPTSAEPTFKETDLDQEISQISSFDDCSCPDKPSLPSEDSCVVRDASVSMAINIPSILEGESHMLSLSSLITPKTPISANKSRTRAKRLSSTKKDKPRSKPSSPIHRPHIVIPGSTRPSYVGVERLNILQRLNKLDKDSLGFILDYLTDSDLVQVVAVSRGWCRIIQEHRRTYRRLRNHLAREAHVKENLDRSGPYSTSISSRDGSLLWKTSSSVVSSFDGSKDSVASSVQRQPFSLCNSIDGNYSAGELSRRHGSVPKSPPVSPSKRKFRDNQKIASHLKKSERLKACPRCEKPSRVVLTKSSIKHALTSGSLDSSTIVTVAGAKLEKSYTLPESLIGAGSGTDSIIVDSPMSPTNSDRIRRNLFSTSLLSRSQSADVNTPRRRSSADALGSSASLLVEGKLATKNGKSKSAEEIQCDYAVCSGKSCGFTFCIKCLCEYHPNTVCKDLAPNSPSKEDEPVHNVACSKQSRRSLLRLRK